MISCITALMNREKALEQMLPSWTRVEKIKEFIIVDWSSDKPIINNSIVQDQMRKYNNIKVIRVENQKYFYRCLAWNLAFQNTNLEDKILLKLDIDYVNINHSWIDCLSLAEDGSLNNYFLTGCDEFMSQSLGFLVINKYNFGNGYNENMEPVWGFEDVDLYARIKRENKFHNSRNTKEYQNWDGLNHMIFFNLKEYVFHIPHNEIVRHENLKWKELTLSSRGEVRPDQVWKVALKNKMTGDAFPTWQPKKYKILEEKTFYKKVELIEN